MVEKWLFQVEEMMLQSVRHVIKEAIDAYKQSLRKHWVVDWPGQVVICSSQNYWTQEVEAAITGNTLKVSFMNFHFYVLLKRF